jgi:class 3 adenylate cyclase
VDTLQHTRRLAAIVFTDIVGFSRLTEGDEVTALELLGT